VDDVWQIGDVQKYIFIYNCYKKGYLACLPTSVQGISELQNALFVCTCFIFHYYPGGLLKPMRPYTIK